MENKIIARLKEQQELREILQSTRAEFVAIYGRRRIGKTYLIHNFFIDCNCTYFKAVGFQGGSMAQQIENFIIDLSKAFYNDEPLKSSPNWEDAFARLTKAIDNKSGNKKNKAVLLLIS